MEIKPEELLFKLQQGGGLSDNIRVLAVYGDEDYYRRKIAAAVTAFIFDDLQEAERDIAD